MVWVVWCVGPLGTAMRVRVLLTKQYSYEYAYALPGSTARQLFISSTLLDSSTARQLLDSSSDLDRPRRPGTAWSRARQARQELDRLDRQGLGSASTEPRQLDSSTARAQLPARPGSARSVSYNPCSALHPSAGSPSGSQGRLRRFSAAPGLTRPVTSNESTRSWGLLN